MTGKTDVTDITAYTGRCKLALLADLHLSLECDASGVLTNPSGLSVFKVRIKQHNTSAKLTE